MLCDRYLIEWHRGKGTWSAWPVGLPVVAMDTTIEKTRRKLYRAIEIHLSVSLSGKCHCLGVKPSL